MAAGAEDEDEEPLVEPVMDMVAELLAAAVSDACADEGRIDTLSPVAFVQEMLDGTEALLLRVRSAH